ncbi:hypothetical protein IV102_27915 [bacterium]|nr:hypothetical protein [bacterium]
MKCQLTPDQVNDWLDGHIDQSLHAADCGECQQRLVSVQKLRSRLAPPPSPLGADFARRTAAQVLRTQRVQDTVQQHRLEKQSGVLNRLMDNPVAHILRRERSRRMFRLPGLSALLLAYLLPGMCVGAGSAEQQMVYFAVLQVGLTLLVPLFLLGLEIASLSSLVRGRCLEEMLQTGLKPQVVSDTLTVNGLRALIPALLLTTLALVPSGHQQLGYWLPCAAASFAGGCYLAQAQLLIQGWPRWFSALGLVSALATLAAPHPWQGLGLLALLALSLWARRRTIARLTAQQAGRAQDFYPRPSRLQLWLSQYLPDLALLQRELRRGPVLSLSVTLGWTAVVVAAFSYGKHEDLLWPAVVLSASAWSALRLLHCEREGGGYEVLVHSGLQLKDWQTSACWLALLQLAPVVLLVPVLWAWPLSAGCWPLRGPAALALILGSALLMLVSLWSGCVVGIGAASRASSAREVSKELAKESLLVTTYALFLLGLTAVLLGRNSSLQECFGLDPLLAGAWRVSAFLPISLAGYLRARQVTGDRPHQFSQLPLLGLASPWVLWGSVLQPAAVLLGCLWFWWWSPLAPTLGRLQTSLQKKTWTALVLSNLIGIPLGVWLLNWVAFMLTVAGAFSGVRMFGYEPLILWVALAATLLITVGLRKAGQLHPGVAGPGWRRRTRVVSILGLVTVSTFALLLQRQVQQPSPLWVAQRDQFLRQYAPRPIYPQNNRPLTLLPSWFKGVYDGFALTLSDPRTWGTSNGAVVEFFARHPEKLQKLQADLEQLVTICYPITLCNALMMATSSDLYEGHSEAALDKLQLLARVQPALRKTCWGQDRLQLITQIRARVLLGLRAQLWDRKQLLLVDLLLSQLEDSPQDIRFIQIQHEARAYVDNRWWGPRGVDGWLYGAVQRREAECRLQRCLETGKAEPSEWEVCHERNYILLQQATQIALQLEQERLRNGGYPRTWSGSNAVVRAVYDRSADGKKYSLRLWAHTEPPSTLTTSDNGYRLSTF